jgi:hypothetical protein
LNPRVAILVGSPIEPTRLNWTEVNFANNNPATRYVYPDTGRSIIVDDITNELLHVGGDTFGY